MPPCAAMECARRGVLKAEALDVVAELAEGGGGGAAGEAGTDDDEIMPALVGGIDELHLEAGVVPGLFDGSGRNSCVQCNRHGYFTRHHFTHPASTATGIEM